MEDKMNLKIRRERRFSYAARSIQICIDGIPATKIKNGAEAIIPISSGVHSVLFQIGGKTMAIASITANDNDIFISCWASGIGIEVYSASHGAEIQLCRHGQGVYSVILAFVLIICLLFLFFFVFSFQGFIFIF